MSDLKIRMIERLSEIDREQWDSVANPDGQPFDPFISWDFLQALEESGCAVEQTGWGPRHLLAEKDEVLVGALPLYLKGHSQGEYVFDHSWAQSYENVGGQYYPKLLTAVPFTPATGRRVLTQDESIRSALVSAAQHICLEWQTSSWHILFPGKAECEALCEDGLMQRNDVQYIWENAGYESYDDFLDALSSRKRKALRKERRQAQEGVEILQLTGSDLNEAHWDVFFECYQDTGARKWGQPYLNRQFFSIIHERMADKVLLVIAQQDDRMLASALNFIGSDTLYGRYWGALDFHDKLHFELCYHQALDYAIKHGLKQVEAGAQGQHKIARGYRPRPVYSLHHFAQENFGQAVDDFLNRERKIMAREIDALDADSPYKRSL